MEQVRVLYHLVVMVTCLVCLGSNVGMCSRSDPFIKNYVSSSLPSNDGLVYLDVVRKISAWEWDSLVIQSKVPVMVAFKTDWCTECNQIIPILVAMGKRFNNKFKFYTIDSEMESDIAIKYRISYDPTTIVFKDGEEKDRVVGYDTYMLEDLTN